MPIDVPLGGTPRVARVHSHILNVSAKTNWYFVSVQDDAGRTAWGEASINGWETVLGAALDRLRPDIEGLPLPDALAMLRPHAQSPGGLAANAIVSALQQALVALQAAASQVPVHAVLGRQLRHQVPVYANINRATTVRTPQGFVATALRARAEGGYQRFKAAPFDGLTPAICATPEGERRMRQWQSTINTASGPRASRKARMHATPWRMRCSPSGVAHIAGVSPSNGAALKRW